MEKESMKPSKLRTKLNTKGCCFLCLTVISIDATVPNPLVSLKTFQRYFRLSTSKEKRKGSSLIQQDQTDKSTSLEQEDNIKVELCECCTKVVGSFMDAFLSLEKAQMEVDYWSERVHHQISEGSKKPEGVQIYSKRMTGDAETLTQLVFVDNLRKEISRKSLTGKVGSQATIHLHRSKWTPKRKDLENQKDDGDHMWSQSAPDGFEENNDSEDDQSSHQFSMDNENEDVGKAATIKQEKLEILPQVLPPEAQTQPQLATSKVSKLYVRNQITGSYSCTSCSKQLNSKLGAQLHHEAIHLGKRWTCQICESKFTTPSSLNTHKKSCNGKKRKSSSHSTVKKWRFNSKTGKYACAACTKEFSRHPAAHTHYDAIHLKRKHKCEICNMAVFSHKTNLRRHQKTCEATLKMRLSKSLARKK